jgi:foldase protein PrsA
MPNKKAETKSPAKKTKSAIVSSKVTVSKSSESSAEPTNIKSKSRLQNLRSSKKIWILAVLIILAALIYANKKHFVAATVNGQPITGLELMQRVNSLHREKTLTQMVNEKILDQEATKKGIIVTQQETNSKILEIENQYGGADTFNSLLQQQGISKEDFTRQTRLQLLAEKLYAQEATPSAEEIEDFLTQNKDDPAATDAAKFRQTAIDSLKQQKLSEVFSQKFQELKNAAKITTF